MDDVRAVMDAARSARAARMGVSEGGRPMESAVRGHASWWHRSHRTDGNFRTDRPRTWRTFGTPLRGGM